MTRASCASALASMCICAAHAQCMVGDVPQASPIAPAAVAAKELSDAEGTLAQMVKARDYGSLAAAVAVAIRAKDYDSLATAATAAIDANDMRSLKTVMRMAIESRDFKALDAMIHPTLNRWAVMREIGTSMSFISATCRRGMYLESIGADTSEAWLDLMKAIEMMHSEGR